MRSAESFFFIGFFFHYFLHAILNGLQMRSVKLMWLMVSNLAHTGMSLVGTKKNKKQQQQQPAFPRVLPIGFGLKVPNITP